MTTVIGLDQVLKNVQKIKTRKAVATIFGLDDKTKSEYVDIITIKRRFSAEDAEPSTPKEILSSVVEEKNALRDLQVEKDLIQQFDEVKKHLQADKCYYIVYDCRFYNNAKAYRSLVCLIAYIPDNSSDPSLKFAYSSNSLNLKVACDLTKTITVNSWDMLNYQQIAEECAGFAKF